MLVSATPLRGSSPRTVSLHRGGTVTACAPPAVSSRVRAARRARFPASCGHRGRQLGRRTESSGRRAVTIPVAVTAMLAMLSRAWRRRRATTRISKESGIGSRVETAISRALRHASRAALASALTELLRAPRIAGSNVAARDLGLGQPRGGYLANHGCQNVGLPRMTSGSRLSGSRGEPMPPRDPARGGLGANLRRAWMASHHRLVERLAAAGLADRALPDGRVLAMCAEDAATIVSDIGRGLGISRQGAAKIVARLADRGFLTATASRTTAGRRWLRSHRGPPSISSRCDEPARRSTMSFAPSWERRRSPHWTASSSSSQPMMTRR